MLVILRGYRADAPTETEKYFRFINLSLRLLERRAMKFLRITAELM